jgi:GxxExxY protein
MTRTGADNADDFLGLRHGRLTQAVIGAFYRVYDYFGYGFQEAGYRRALCLALRKAGLKVEEEVSFDMLFEDVIVARYRADVIVEGKVIVETKAGLTLDPAAAAQLLNYLKLTKLEVGLIVHFGPSPAVKRLISSRNRLQDITPKR